MIGIYKIINLINRKIYVGSAVDIKSRWRKHKSDLLLNKHHSIKLQNSYNKYGVDNFVYEIIEECEKERMIEREQYYIDLYDSFNKGYNCRPKAENNFGIKWSQETKIKLSKSNTGLKRSKEAKKNISNGCIGRILTKETKDKISEAHKGKKMSENVKIKISQKNKGKKL